VKTGGAKPWVYRSVQDCQAAEGLFVLKVINSEFPLFTEEDEVT